jgi:hypothetical protein
MGPCLTKRCNNRWGTRASRPHEISRDVGAGYLERKRAIEQAQSAEFEIQLVDRWSEQIRNLEDILFAAYCNGVLEPLEKKRILQYAGRLEISQAQLDRVQNEAKSRYADYKA